MKEIVFATNNENKLKEVKILLQSNYDVKGLKDINCLQDIPEPYDTLEENSLAKAKYVYDNYNINCFADDTGLEVKSLNNLPGVLSARYGGEEKNSEKNMEKLLRKMNGIEDREARFRTVVTLILDGEIFVFEGIVNGEILHKKHGNKGFGYDPIFKPLGYNNTFAELDMNTKNLISHRGKAVRKLVGFLNKH